MKTKTYRARVKAIGDTGEFEAVVSVFGNVDYANDRVVKGAFADSLKAWRESGDPIPVVFSHQWDNLDAHVGQVDPSAAVETDDGLQVKGVLDIDDDPAAAKVHRLLKTRRIREFSFAYDVVSEAKASDGANDLQAIDIIELGPTLKGMNPATQLIGAKRRDAGRKVYAALAGSIEERQRAISSAVRATVDDDDQWAFVEATFDDHVVWVVEGDAVTYWQADYTVDDDNTATLSNPVEVAIDATVTPKTSPASAGDPSTSDDEAAKSTAKPEEPSGAKGEEPTTRSPSHVRLLAELDALDLAEV